MFGLHLKFYTSPVGMHKRILTNPVVESLAQQHQAEEVSCPVGY